MRVHGSGGRREGSESEEERETNRGGRIEGGRESKREKHEGGKNALREITK